MRLFRTRRTEPPPEAIGPLRRELLRLDPWAFWTVELEPGSGAEFAVLGTTGAFAVTACGLEGYLVAEGRKLLVDRKPIGGYAGVKRAAKAVSGELLSAGAASREVVPVIVLTRAVAGASRDLKGVRVMRLQDVIAEMTNRERVLDPSTAERLAGRLGRVLVGPVQRPSDPEEG